MQSGKVKFFNTEKGYGFIIKDEGGEIFFHATTKVDQLKQNDLVMYDIGENKKGPIAINVKRTTT